MPRRRDEWTSEPVDRSGLAAFVHLIRDPSDPPEMTRKQRKAAGVSPLAWRTSTAPSTAGEWRSGLLASLAAGPKTFNRMVVELSGGALTADRASGKAPDKALWALVGEGLLEHTFQAPVLFRLAKRRRKWREKNQLPLPF